MKMILFVVCFLVGWTPVLAGDLWEKDSYQDRADSMDSDYDNDGRDNYIDPHDNDWHKNEAYRDYDNDGRDNYIDAYDNDWRKE